MSHTINSLREQGHNSFADVYEIFQNFFGEPFTDIELSGGRAYIYVWWPRVTITNENNRSINIQDLYAKIPITNEGRIPYESRGFQLVRTTFPEVQYSSGYLHSHIPRFTAVPSFNNPCLGTGPINNTIMDLKNAYEETLWMLFCQELALYVTVESLRGGPYFRMEQVGSEGELRGFGGYNGSYDDFNSLNEYYYEGDERKEWFRNLIKQFTLYYLENGHLSLNYKEESFKVGMPYFDYMVDISNSFIEYYNIYAEQNSLTQQNIDDLFIRHILVKALAADGKFYKSNYVEERDYSQYEGQRILTFKGEAKLLHIEREASVHTEVTILLHHKIAMFILQNILKIINYRYKNEHNGKNYGSKSSKGTAKASSSTYQTVCYL